MNGRKEASVSTAKLRPKPVSNGLLAVAEGANMPSTREAVAISRMRASCPGNYVLGANIGGFVKVADAMLAQCLI